MVNPTEGTYTFLFTDIEGSTRLLQRLGNDYPQVIEQHNRLIREAVAKAGASEVDNAGDGFFFVFPTTSQALEAAVEAQRSLADYKWPRGGSIHVRMGIHTGEAVFSGGNYLGLDVHRAARICAAGHGSQILISSSAHAFIGHALPTDVSTKDLGCHFLKDIEQPEHLYQINITGLWSDFPPPRARNARPHNLPSELSDFVDRENELGEITNLLAENRLVTLTGPGGTGKTRLGLRVAAEVLPRFTDGVFFIPLALIQDAQLVASTIGKILGLSEIEGRSNSDVLADYLASKELLLILDNFEQVLGAAILVSNLLTAAPGLRVLVTSRTRLIIRGEQVYQVPPFDTPQEGEYSNLDQLARVNGIDLFVRRAKTADPNFILTQENAASVIQIVRRLEGLPLAIELAAVQCRMFEPKTLARLLDQKFKILRGGSKDLPARHQTLRGTIAWSYTLLDPTEQAIFRRLGVFVGGFSLDAVEAVVDSDLNVNVLEVLTSLLDKSLLQRRVQYGEVRLSMLEMIREFALEELVVAGETQRLSALHACYFLSLAEEDEPHLTRQEQAAVIDRLSADLDNFRAAIRYCLENGDFETGLRIESALWRFWHAIGQIREGRDGLEMLLARVEGHPRVRAKGMAGLAGLAYWQADYDQALACYKAALAIYQEIGDKYSEADILLSMSTTYTWMGDVQTGGRLADQALDDFQSLGNREKEGMAFMAKGFAFWKGGDLDRARPFWEASLNIALEVGDYIEAATKRLALASIIFQQGERLQALNNSLDVMQDLVRLKNVTFTIMALDWIAAIAAYADPEGGVRLAGAANGLREILSGGMRPEASGLENARVTAGRELDSETIERLWAEGRDMNFNQAIEYAKEVGEALLAGHILN
ncbi:MAG TPA: adenylate/guanylate cyclase domain-containing protein [Anaerolineales bacterium]|nr:adenylate/guanylate cyclase domain-containing protein [Anaerolineales bacterium]